MASFQLDDGDYRARALPGGGLVLAFPLSQVAADKGWTVNVGDTVRTPLLDLPKIAPNARSVWIQKSTGAANADVLYALQYATDAAGEAGFYLPCHLHTGGAAPSWTNTAADHTGYRTTLMFPFMQAVWSPATSVPSYYTIWMFFLRNGAR